MKLSKKQLTQLQQAKQNIDFIQLEIGKIEIHKNGLLKAFKEENEKFEQIKTQIYNDFGEVSIDIQTGECTPKRDS